MKITIADENNTLYYTTFYDNVTKDRIKFNLNNANFLRYSNLRNRLNTQLFYVHFEFSRNLSSNISNIFDSNQLEKLAYFKNKNSGSIANNIAEFLSLNAVDIDIPTITQSLSSQRLFNKNYQYSTGGTYDGNINIGFMESNDLFISNFFNALKDVNFSANVTTIKYYPNELFMDIYVIPIRMLKVETTDERKLEPDFSKNRAVMIFENCLFESMPDMDYSLSGDGEITPIKISFQYEKRYLLNKYVKIYDKNGKPILEIT